MESTLKTAEMIELSPKRERFCQEYLVDLNGTQAAIRAGYSEKSANEQAARLLAIDSVRARVDDLKVERARRVEVTQDMVIAELKKIAFSNMKKFASWGGGTVTLEESVEMDDDSASCVSMVSQTETKDGGSVSFKLHDKVKALELLGSHIGMFVRRVDHTTKGEKLDNMTTKEIAEKIVEEMNEINQATADE